MNNNDSVDKIHQQDQSLEQGSNKKFLNTHHAQYQEGDQIEHQENVQDQSNDQSIDRCIKAMSKDQQDEKQAPTENQGNSRGNRGNRGDRGNQNLEQEQRPEIKQEQEEKSEEEKPQPRRGRGRMPNNLSDDQKQPELSTTNRQDQKPEANSDLPKEELNEEDKKSEKEKANQSSDSGGWDESVDKKAAQNEQISQGRNGRSGRGQPEAKVEENNKILDESNWQDQADNKKQKQEQKPKRRGNKNDQDQQELKPDKDKSEWMQNQASKQPQNAGRGRGNRGNRQNREQNGQSDNQAQSNSWGNRGRGNRDFNNDSNSYQNRPQYNRGQNNFGRNRQNNYGRQREGGQGNWRGGNRGGSRGGFRGGFRGNQDRQNNGDNQERGGRNFNRGGYNNDRQDNRQQQSKSQNNQSSNMSSKVQSPIYDAVSVIEPKGTQSWPEVSFYVRKCKVSVTLRTINENKADAIVFPFQDMKFKLYPSTLICEDSKFNYRKKIQEKQDNEYFKERNCYPKKGEPIGNFNDVLFWKVTSRDPKEFKKFILQLFKFMDLDKKSKSVVFPICKQLGGFEVLLASVIECLHSLSKHNQGFIQKFEFTTKDPEYFKEAGRVFWENIVDHIDSNQIYIL